MWNLRLTSFRAWREILEHFCQFLEACAGILSGVHGYLAHHRHCLLPATDSSNPETCSWTRRSNENAPAPLTTTTKPVRSPADGTQSRVLPGFRTTVTWPTAGCLFALRSSFT